MYVLRKTWKGVFSEISLSELDKKTKEIDPAWPILAKVEFAPLDHLVTKRRYVEDESINHRAETLFTPPQPAKRINLDLNDKEALKVSSPTITSYTTQYFDGINETKHSQKEITPFTSPDSDTLQQFDSKKMLKLDTSLADTEIDSLVESVMDKSFEAIDLGAIESCFKEPTGPSAPGKNMERLQQWYERKVADEWIEYYAQEDSNGDADDESDSSESSDDDESITTLETLSNSDATHADNGEIYCICRGPDNHEAMVACDGPKCQFSWFHFSCVGLPPNWSSEENWLCEECRET